MLCGGTLKTALDLGEGCPVSPSPGAVQPCLCCAAFSCPLCLSPRGCCALPPFTTSDPASHATCSACPQEVDADTVFSVSQSVVSSWSYLGALKREKTSCYKPFEITISLLTVVFSFFINGTKKAVFYHEDHSSARKLFCGAFMSRSTSSSLLVLWV